MKCFFLTFISFIFVINVLAQTEGTFTYFEESIFAPTSREAYDWFGSPCFHGDILMVGAIYSIPDCSAGCGAGYVNYYEKNVESSWDLIQRIESPEPEDCDHFGSDIAI
ncbi:MAG: hypothetical protein JW798_14315, partial [Prolixibacteraceae bacterium]|nr:hypothetical protein [Prolixibacteraceae bacterium]